MKHWKLYANSAYGKPGSKYRNIFFDRTKNMHTPRRADSRFRRRNAILAGQNWRDHA